MRAFSACLFVFLAGHVATTLAQETRRPAGAPPALHQEAVHPVRLGPDVAVESLNVYFIGSAPRLDTVMMVAATRNVGSVAIKRVLQCLAIRWENCEASAISDYAPGETRYLVGFVDYYRGDSPGQGGQTPAFRAYVGSPGFYTHTPIDHHQDDVNPDNDRKEVVMSELDLHHGRPRLASSAYVASMEVTPVDRQNLTSRIDVRVSNRGPETVRNLRLTLLSHGAAVAKQWQPIGIGPGASVSVSYLDHMNRRDDCTYWVVLNALGPDPNPIDTKHGGCSF
jgi:hypothetical protein